MNNLFYSLEDGKYYTYPDGDEATGIQIREVIEANERSISKLQQETEKLKKQYCERTDCGGRIGNSKKVEELQKENKQLKELIDTILNWNIFKNECPMNFGYDEETNEDKAQDVFYKDDDYCENNCNDDYTKCWLKYFKRMQELEKGDSNE